MTNILAKIDIVGVSDLGDCFGYVDLGGKKRIFVPKAIVGDKVEVKIRSQNNTFLKADLTNIISPSKFRRRPPCSYFQECGGCSLQHLDKEYYREFKKKILSDLLQNHNMSFQAGISWVFIGENTRRRVFLQVGKDHSVGFFKEGGKQLIPIKNCLILESELSSLIPYLQKFLHVNSKDFYCEDKKTRKKKSLVTQILLTKFDNGISIVFNFSDDQLNQDLLQKFTNFAIERQIINLSYEVNNKLTPIYQRQSPKLIFGDIKIDLPDKTFLQATKVGESEIINQINNFIKNSQNIGNPINNVIDLYCGLGTYSFAINTFNKNIKIDAFEGNKNMASTLRKNISTNNLQSYIKSYEVDLFQSPILSKNLKGYDLAIINPPRNGAKTQINNLAKSNIANIIYVSCNPKTFVNDAKVLILSGYKITKFTAIDQFYYTPHIELVAIFQK